MSLIFKKPLKITDIPFVFNPQHIQLISDDSGVNVERITWDSVGFGVPLLMKYINLLTDEIKDFAQYAKYIQDFKETNVKGSTRV